MASIVVNGAAAIAKTFAQFGWPAGIPLAALQAAAVAGQLAIAANAPIPQYKDGVANHPGGAFIAGDGGERELIKPKGKPAYWSESQSTLYNEPAGTEVIPLRKLVGFAQNNIAGMLAGTPGEYSSAQQRHERDMTTAAMAQVLGGKLDEQTESITGAILSGRRINITVKGGTPTNNRQRR